MRRLAAGSELRQLQLPSGQLPDLVAVKLFFAHAGRRTPSAVPFGRTGARTHSYDPADDSLPRVTPFGTISACSRNCRTPRAHRLAYARTPPESVCRQVTWCVRLRGRSCAA